MMPQDTEVATSQWWRTAITRIKPGSIHLRGYAIEDLMGQVSFAEMIWLMLRGDLPTRPQAQLLEAALVAAVDHGPHAPSIAIARMAATCGVGINGSMASAINTLGDTHGGAGQQMMQMLHAVKQRQKQGETSESAVLNELDGVFTGGGRLPGFGHRFHRIDPRSVRLSSLMAKARANGVIEGTYIDIAACIAQRLGETRSREIPLNIDGSTAILFSELGFEPELGRGLFILSRSVGVLAHAWEQTQQGGRIKGPIPPSVDYLYDGPAPRKVSRDD